MIRFPMQSKVKTVIPRTKESRVRTIFRPKEPLPPPPPPVEESAADEEVVHTAEGESPGISHLAASIPGEQLTLAANDEPTQP
jgi:hypothetical protein